MQGLTAGDFLKRLRQAGIAGQVQATQALEAFRLYVMSEFPTMTAADFEPLFVRSQQLIVRSTNAAFMQAVKDQEEDILRYIKQATGITVIAIRFRA